MHDIYHQIRPHAQQKNENSQQRQHDEFTSVDVSQVSNIGVGDIAENYPLDHPQCVSSAEDQSGSGEKCKPEIGFEARDDNHELTHET